MTGGRGKETGRWREEGKWVKGQRWREGGRDEEKTSVPQMFIRIFITLELQRESLSDSYSVCVCVLPLCAG